MSQTTSQKRFPLLLAKWKLLKRMVGAPRFELGTSWSRTKRATRLRYAPIKAVISDKWSVASHEDEQRLDKLATRHLSLATVLLVGTARFELATPCTPSKCATRLRYVPTKQVQVWDRTGDWFGFSLAPSTWHRRPLPR